VVVLALDEDRVSQSSAVQVVVVAWWAVLGVVLCVLGPTWITWRARRRVEELITKTGADSFRTPTKAEFRSGLERRGRLFDYMVFGGNPPRLDARTLRLKPVARPTSSAVPPT